METKVKVEKSWNYNHYDVLWLTSDPFKFNVMDADGLPLVGSGVDYAKVIIYIGFCSLCFQF